MMKIKLYLNCKNLTKFNSIFVFVLGILVIVFLVLSFLLSFSLTIPTDHNVCMLTGIFVIVDEINMRTISLLNYHPVDCRIY